MSQRPSGWPLPSPVAWALGCAAEAPRQRWGGSSKFLRPCGLSPGRGSQRGWWDSAAQSPAPSGRLEAWPACLLMATCSGCDQAPGHALLVSQGCSPDPFTSENVFSSHQAGRVLWTPRHGVGWGEPPLTAAALPGARGPSARGLVLCESRGPGTVVFKPCLSAPVPAAAGGGVECGPLPPPILSACRSEHRHSSARPAHFKWRVVTLR